MQSMKINATVNARARVCVCVYVLIRLIRFYSIKRKHLISRTLVVNELTQNQKKLTRACRLSRNGRSIFNTEKSRFRMEEG